MIVIGYIKNIPFTNNYEDVVSFANEDLQRSYFLSLQSSYSNANRIRFTDTNVSFILNKNINEMKDISYLTVLQDGKYYYLFVDGVDYVSVDATNVRCTIDVWQTYMFDHEILDSFIKREHQDRFTLDGTTLVPIYNLEKENIELGEEYRQVNTAPRVIKDDRRLSGEPLNIIWYYILTTEVLDSRDSNPNTYKIYNKYDTSLPMPYMMYCFPIHSYIKTELDGSKYVAYTKLNGRNSSNPITTNIEIISGYAINELLKDPKVISVYPSRYAPFYYSVERLKENEYVIVSDSYEGPINEFSSGMFKLSSVMSKRKDFDFSAIKDIQSGLTGLNKTYPVNSRLEPKLYTKPYTVYSFTNLTSESLDLGADEFDRYIKFIESFGTSYKNVLYSDMFDTTSFFNGMTSTKNNELPLMSDRYLDYISNNRASATTGVALNVATGLAGAGVALASGGVGIGLFMGASLAMSSTKAVMSELMKQSDLRQSPLRVKEVGNNIQFNLTLDNNSMYVQGVVRRVKQQFYDRALQYFHRLGYKANRYGIPNLRSRYYFNYIELVSVNIGGNINQNTKAQLEKIYKDGVRLWHCRNVNDFKMYEYRYENVEVSIKGEQ